MGKYVALKVGRIETNYGVVHLEPGESFRISKVPEEYITAGFVKPLREALSEKYNEFKRILSELEVIREEIESENPAFARVIQDAINSVENHYIKENYRGLSQAVKNLKSLYLHAIRGR